MELRSSIDSLVLKAMTLVYTEQWRPILSENCFHLAGKGGTKAAVRCVEKQLEDYPFVMRTDVKQYYASLDHNIMFGIGGNGYIRCAIGKNGYWVFDGDCNAL